MLRHLVAAVGIVLVSLPLGAVLALTLMPAWRWLEARYGIESVGHSGPAEWCYLATFATCVLLIGAVYVRGSRAARANSPP